MAVVDEMEHIVVESEFLESFHKLAASEEAEVEHFDLLVRNQAVACSVKHKCRCRSVLVVYLSFP